MATFCRDFLPRQVNSEPAATAPALNRLGLADIAGHETYLKHDSCVHA
jgi:hypothetical protein